MARLEGTVEHFVIWTDHKNLAYLRSAKRLNSRQARWSLFLSCFPYTLSFCPGSKNGKPDTLSRNSQLTHLMPTLSPSCPHLKTSSSSSTPTPQAPHGHHLQTRSANSHPRYGRLSVRLLVPPLVPPVLREPTRIWRPPFAA